MPSFRKVDKTKKEPKLNDDLIEKICKQLQLGNYIETAVVMAGVSKQSFYTWIKIANGVKPSKSQAEYKRCCKLLDAVERAQEEATTRDLLNIDKSAMGRMPTYDRYPPRSEHNPDGTWIPARDDKGKIQINPKTNEPIMIEVSGQIICDYKGKPIVADAGAPPDWKASAWRLEKRRPKQWGDLKTIVVNEKPDLRQNENPEDDDFNLRITFVDTDGEEEQLDE